MTTTVPPWAGKARVRELSAEVLRRCYPTTAAQAYDETGHVRGCFGAMSATRLVPVRRRMKPREIRSHRDPRRRVSIPELLAAGFGGFVVGAGFLWFIEVVVRHG